MNGRELSHFRVLEQLGAGGMGVVYRGVDVRLNRPVAIKLLAAGATADPLRRERFVREARAASALNHPNIVTIHEIDSDGEQDFIVMELLEGHSLRDAIPPGGLTPKLALDYAAQVARGLAAAHKKGIVHRDLKPENVIVTKDGRVKILDFGLARLTQYEVTPLGSEGSTLAQMTEPGTVLGTVGYMSPEQVHGRPADHRSDIFSFGTILYEMLTGRRAFQGDSRVETLNAILKEEPPALERPASGIAPAVERIVRQCLEKAPERRFQSAHDLAFALEAPGELRQPAREGGIDRRRIRRAVGVGLVLTLLLALAGLDVGGVRTRLGGGPPSQSVRSLVVLPLQNLSRDPEQDYFADGMTDALIGTLSKIAALRVISRTSAMRYKATSKPVPEIARELNVDAIVEGSVLRSGDRVRISVQLVRAAGEASLWSESYERDLRDVLALQSELARAITQQIRVTLTPQEHVRLASASAVDPEVYQAYLRGRHHFHGRSEEQLRKAIGYFQQALVKDPNYAPAYAGMADCYSALGSVGIGRPPAETRPLAVAAARKALALDADLAEAHASLAHANFYDWNWGDAERGFRRALELNPNYALGRSWYAQYALARGRPDEALMEARRAQQLDPLSPSVQVLVGYVLYLTRHYDEAIRQFRSVLELAPDHLFAHWQLGLSYAEKSMPDQAIAELQTAAKLSPGGGSMLGFLGAMYARAGRRAEAVKVLEQLTDIAKKQYVTPGAFISLYVALGENERAYEWLDRAYEERSNLMVYLGVFPYFDPIRSDPRFQDLLKRVGLPTSAPPG